MAIVAVILIIHTEEGQATFGMCPSDGCSQLISLARIVVEFLQGMNVVEVTTLVALLRMVGSHPIALLIIHIRLLVVVDVFVVVVGSGIDDPRGRGEASILIGKTKKIIISVERTDALHKLHAPPCLLNREVHHLHSTSQTASCQIDGRVSSMK